MRSSECCRSFMSPWYIDHLNYEMICVISNYMYGVTCSPPLLSLLHLLLPLSLSPPTCLPSLSCSSSVPSSFLSLPLPPPHPVPPLPLPLSPPPPSNPHSRSVKWSVSTKMLQNCMQRKKSYLCHVRNSTLSKHYLSHKGSRLHSLCLDMHRPCCIVTV